MRVAAFNSPGEALKKQTWNFNMAWQNIASLAQGRLNILWMPIMSPWDERAHVDEKADEDVTCSSCVLNVASHGYVGIAAAKMRTSGVTR